MNLKRLATPQFAVLAISVVAVVLLAIHMAVTVLRERDDAFAAAERTALNQSIALEQHVARTVDSVDAVIRSIITITRQTPSQTDLRAEMQWLAASAPQIGNIGVLDANGTLVRSSFEAPGGVKYADREFFQLHRDSPSAGLHISPPVLGRVSQGWTVPLSRRITTSDGTFGGVVVVALDPSYFNDFLRKIDLGPHGTLNVYLVDGTVIARAPSGEISTGKSAAAGPIFTQALPKASNGVFRAVTFIGHVNSIISYRRVENLPLVVAVAIAVEDALAGWHAFLLEAAMVWVGATLLIAAFAALALFTLRALSRTNQRLKAVFAASPLGVVELDGQGRVQVWTPAAERILGWRANEVLGRPLSDLPAALRTPLEAIPASGGKPGQPPVELQLSRRDGSLVDVSLWSGVHREPDGSIALLADITERKHAEAQLRQAQRLNAIGQLTGGVAHEFNNILQVVIGNLDLIDDTEPVGREAGELISRVRRAAEHGAKLTHHLLAFSRRQPLRPAPVDPSEALRGMEQLLRPILGENYTLRMSIQPGVSRVMADVSQLNSAILNLVLNARDAMPGGGRIAVDVRDLAVDRDLADRMQTAPGRYVAFEVVDTGTGMTPEVSARAIEPFFTTKEVGKGTGLGLSMVDGFVRQSGGAMEIDSAVGRGTAIRLVLPAVHGAAQAERVYPQPSAVRGSQVTVLVVEDETEVLETAASMLRSLGMRVLKAADGPAALEILRTRVAIDVLFTDVIMPHGMSGLMLAEEALKLRPKIKVVYASGYNENVIVHAGSLDLGVTLLSKPYSREDLARVVGGISEALVPALRASA